MTPAATNHSGNRQDFRIAPRPHRRGILALAAASLLLNRRLAANSLPPALTDSIDRGVRFLLSLQKDDGSIADKGNPTAITSLAIMALSATGRVPDGLTAQGRAVGRAIDYVLRPDRRTGGYFGHRDGSRMYGHGITTLMLTEMAGMGTSPEQNAAMHDAVAAAVDVIVASQRVDKPAAMAGGWRYTPDAKDSDLSVSVWQVMALRSAKNDGFDVPAEAIDAAVAYLHRSATSPLDPSGAPRDDLTGFSYAPGSSDAKFTMTAAGLLALQTCGQYDTPLTRAAAAWLMAHPPQTRERFFFYGIYYYAQGMFQVGGAAAEQADRRTDELLLPMQDSDGAWRSRSGEERNIGDVYTTALAMLSLSVRYHYLPIYQR